MVNVRSEGRRPPRAVPLSTRPAYTVAVYRQEEKRLDMHEEQSEQATGRAEAEGLVSFIGESPSMFHTVAAARTRLEQAGYTYLPEGASWQVEPGSRCYTVRNNSSLVAWRVGSEVDPAAYHFQLTAAHSDSPTFKLKAQPEIEGPDGYLRLDVEAYGGMMDYTWFDRPLSLAGRVMVRDGGGVASRLVALDRDVAVIPSVAIHMNREVNKGFAPNRATDLCPLVSAGECARGFVDALLVEELGVEPAQIVARDLYLVNRVVPRIWGANGEFISAPHLDDLMCAYAAMRAFVQSANERTVSVFACFDSEEVGSATMQGAESTFLRDTLARVNGALGANEDDFHRALSSSMLVSCDNAHAVHPNHPELSDAQNAPHLNRGLVIKEAANQHYCTDGFSRAVLQAVLDDAEVPYQLFANRSDMAGGSTLGNISNTHVSVHAVDVGCAQLAMHASYETAGARDVQLAIDALRAFYDADIVIDGADAARW